MSNLKKTSELNFDGLVIVDTLPLIRFNNAVQICKEIARRKKILAFWKIDVNNQVINIYTKIENENEAKNIINKFESEYMSIIAKQNKIINHKHKK